MKKWVVKDTYKDGVNIVEQLLKTRGITEMADIETFMHPVSLTQLFNNTSDEFKEALAKSKKIVGACMRDGYAIVVHGDYDADGITSTAILYNTIKKEQGYGNTSFFIPNRFEHGYGVSIKSIDDVVSRNPGSKILFITVDSGITAREEVDYIKSLGHKVIITDLHHKPDELPKADSIIWNDKLVGASVAWIFSKVLGSKDKTSVALAALATITDLQPVLGFNRSIVKKGLEVLNAEPPLGIKLLLEMARKREGEITTYDLGWVIGPRLNASGRLVDATKAVELFTSEDIAQIRNLANELNTLNSDRQDKTIEMYSLTSAFDSGEIPKIIVTENEEYHEGIIGLVAARLVQRYYRPAIVISLNENYGKGSVRSVAGINIIEVLQKFEDLFESLGGHPMAAGFTIRKERISDLRNLITEYACENFSDDLLVPEIQIGLELPINVVDLALAEELDRMKPFGLGNEEPVFMSEGLNVVDVSYVGKENKHISLKFFSGGKYLKGVYFNGAEDPNIKDINVGTRVNVVYTLKQNTFNGRTNVDLIIKELALGG